MAIGTLAAALAENGEGSCLILDGGLGTELEKQGHDIDHPLWSAKLLVEEPETLADVNRAFARAGADILATATYQATFPGLEKLGLTHDEAVEIFRKGVRITREVADEFDPPKLVGASIGSYGAYLADGSEYSGDYRLSDTELREFHRERLTILAEETAGRDLIAFETLPNGPESKVLADLLEDFPNCEAWFSFSCRNDRELRDGTPIEKCLRFLAGRPQVAAIGVNCIEPGVVPELIRRLAGETDKPVMVYPNSGKGWDSESQSWCGGESDAGSFAEQAVAWRNAGARIIGGCCRTTPEHIQRIREKLASAVL